MALEDRHTFLEIADPPRNRVIRPDRLSIFERRDPFAELTGPNCDNDEDNQTGDSEYRNADDQKNEQRLHEAPTFRD
jgi:hypothetical protein